MAGPLSGSVEVTQDLPNLSQGHYGLKCASCDQWSKPSATVGRERPGVRDEKPYCCDGSQKVFKPLNNQHSHTGEGTYCGVCVCGKAFSPPVYTYWGERMQLSVGSFQVMGLPV